MPYDGEFAQHRSIRRLSESQRVNDLLGSYRVRDRAAVSATLPNLAMPTIIPGTWSPSWVLAVDGSHVEVDVRNGYPGAEASYVTVASVLLDVAKMRSLETARPIDPRKFRTLERAECIDCALPGRNVVRDQDRSPRDSFRRSMFDVFQSVRMSSDAESLLDTYEALLRYKPSSAQEQRCPYEDCPIRGEYSRGAGEYRCTCPEQRPLFSTDALRIHERMNPIGNNGAIFAEIMQVWERVWLIHILRTLEAKRWLSSLRRLAIVLDGPLAVFGQPAWLSQAIYQELSRINQVARRFTGGQDLLLVGIEKTGLFVDHLSNIDKNEKGIAGQYPTGQVGLITDEYVKRHIVLSDSAKPYGDDTYFGRKFFYKTFSGAMIVATIPFLEPLHRDVSRADVTQYPRLADALNVLEQLVSSRYPNALMPLVSAHAEAAIPLNIGKKVLESLARELIDR